MKLITQAVPPSQSSLAITITIKQASTTAERPEEQILVKPFSKISSMSVSSKFGELFFILVIARHHRQASRATHDRSLPTDRIIY